MAPLTVIQFDYEKCVLKSKRVSLRSENLLQY